MLVQSLMSVYRCTHLHATFSIDLGTSMQECHVKEFLYNSMLTCHFLEHGKLLNWLKMKFTFVIIQFLSSKMWHTLNHLFKCSFIICQAFGLVGLHTIGIVPLLQLLTGPYNEMVHLSQLFCGN